MLHDFLNQNLNSYDQYLSPASQLSFNTLLHSTRDWLSSASFPKHTLAHSVSSCPIAETSQVSKIFTSPNVSYFLDP